MSLQGGYEFNLQCLIDAVWKLFGHNYSQLLCIEFVRDYLIQSDQALNYPYVFIHNTV